jgi:hypothetical protein
MKTYTAASKHVVLAAVAFFGLMVGQSLAEVLVITDPVLNTGKKAVNKSGRPVTPADDSASEAALEALPGFAGIGDFAFAGNQSSKNEYIFDFTGEGTVDLRLRYSGSVLGAPVSITNVAYTTSLAKSMRFQAGGSARSVKMKIDVGTYSGEAFAADKGVKALGFTLSLGASDPQQSIEINYFDSADKLLSAQTVKTATSAVTYRFSGYESAEAPIAYVEISYTTGAVAPVVTLDDLSFAAVQ